MKNRAFIFVLLFVLLFVAFIGDLLTGNAPITPAETWLALFGTSGDEIIDEIIRNYRLPKAITAAIAGSALSLSGLLMQTLFRNPLAGPDVLGVSAGAGLGVALLTMLSGTIVYPFISAMGSMAQIIAAIAGAAVVLVLILAVSARIKDSITILVLGMIFGYVASALVTILQSFADPDSLKVFVTWTFGSLGGVTWNKMPFLLVLTAFGILVSLFLQKSLNSLLLGENYAASTGLNIKRIRISIIAIAAVVTGAVTAFTGPIAFVGVVIPHFARTFFGTVNHKTVLPATLLMGSILLLICDIVSQIPLTGRTLPVNAVTAVFGAPMIVWIVLKRKKL
ncbi:FecCD family ABC transporter permease [Proteiniphilum sp. UBA5510]|uniref:FecCD family ABC transporter permease n=1 Tax=Proteiniphilum sp. UBA5510 TaxID=1947286 RepID=UPI000E80A5B4|nr:iron ABC transporter permease [Proteiniphilum sp. UBA5510]MDD4630881.1 iron ABC transporter permease [Proteiniphilum sp.]HBG59133.1 iron ABC transporter [Porphyromonadaceae bacterium]